MQFEIQLGALIWNKQEVLGWKDEDTRALIQDVKTRWNSTLDMLERFHYLQEPVKKVLEDEEWKEKITVKTGGNAGRYVKFTGNDWKLMEKVVKVLGPFKEATLKLSSASSCISQSIPIITSLLHTLKPSDMITDLGVKDLKKRLRDNLNRRLEFLESSEIHNLATLLDPRYRNCFFTSNDAKELAEKKLVEKLKTELLSGPLSRQNSLEEVEDPGLCDGLEAAFRMQEELVTPLRKKQWRMLSKPSYHQNLRHLVYHGGRVLKQNLEITRSRWLCVDLPRTSSLPLQPIQTVRDCSL